MKNIIILSVVLLILGITTFLISCNDFLSPTIEIFNETKTPINQDSKQKQENINQEQKFLEDIMY